jgi:hypothetical protein
MSTAAENWNFGRYDRLQGPSPTETATVKKTARVREFASKYRADYKVEAGGGMVLLTGYRPTGELTAIMVYRFVCLPDTVDPRGPKGK